MEKHKVCCKTLYRNAKKCDKEETEKGQDLKGHSDWHREVTRTHSKDTNHQKNLALNFVRIKPRVNAVAAGDQTAVAVSKGKSGRCSQIFGCYIEEYEHGQRLLP